MHGVHSPCHGLRGVRRTRDPAATRRARDTGFIEHMCELEYLPGRKAHPVGLALTSGVTGSAGAERAMKRKITRALGYSRCSTEEQAATGHGLAAQHDTITAEAGRRGWDVTMYADEGATGKRINPTLADCLAQLRTGRADALIVAKMDRLARSVLHAADIMNAARTQGWDLIVCDLGVDLSTPQGKAMANMLATFAELERDMISQRTKEGLAAAKATGKRIGAPRLVTAQVVDQIVTAREQGESFDSIARTLSEGGVLSPAGRPTWQPSTVRRAYNAATKATA